jgi:hypothetical protein
MRFHSLKIRGDALRAAVEGVIPIAPGTVVFLIPRPDAVKPAGWAVLAIFTATVLGLNLRPLPLAAVALIGEPRTDPATRLGRSGRTGPAMEPWDCRLGVGAFAGSGGRRRLRTRPGSR